jgi:hypothetical protein
MSSILRVWIIVIAASALAGCEFRPEILSANAHKAGDDEVIELSLKSRDAATIKSRQLYFTITVINCDENQKRFPLEPYVAGQRATKFKFSTHEESVKITGSMPARMFDQIRRPCAFVEGGGYFTGHLVSTPRPIMTVSDEAVRSE